MTYLNLLRDADRQLDDGRITIGEYEQMIKPLECEVQPEVVRCGECRHRDPEDKKCDCGHDIIWQLPRGDDWYCADAERRTDGENLPE